MSVKEKLKDSNSILEVNIGLTLIKIVNNTTKNGILLQSILKRQLEILEVLNETPENEIKKSVENKLTDLLDSIQKISDDFQDSNMESLLK
jgi:hypothetical protein